MRNVTGRRHQVEEFRIPARPLSNSTTRFVVTTSEVILFTFRMLTVVSNPSSPAPNLALAWVDIFDPETGPLY